jgi:hypothetical protein
MSLYSDPEFRVIDRDDGGNYLRFYDHDHGGGRPVLIHYEDEIFVSTDEWHYSRPAHAAVIYELGNWRN